MASIDLVSNSSPKIRITEVAGSLAIRAWDADSIRIAVEDREEVEYSFENNVLKLSTDSDCAMRVPSGSSFEIEEIAGNAAIVDVEGEIKITEVAGNLNMKNVGPTTITEVAGNFDVRGVEGNLNVSEIAGNATLRDVEGNIRAEVGSNLYLRDPEGNVNVETGGNAELRMELQAGGKYKVNAGGNLFCHIDPPGNAVVHLNSESERMQIYTENEKQTRQVEEFEFTLGKGGAELDLSAGGQIDFRCRERREEFSFGVDLDFVDDIAGLADEISEQVSSQMETQIEALNEQLTSLGDRLRQSGGRHAHAAQRRVEQAQRRLERKLQGRTGRTIITTAGKPAEPVSAQERALILQMVQEKKINVAEAEMLLNTLEGRKPSQPEPKAETEPAQPEKKEGENA
jgi:hypothetical protein